ncbi:Acetylcholine receptor subunit alpha-like [Harpegnathos saltator]|uniref:Acetylcholine receptor subunit alpha-like n=1 Tax=Harpegnathos saltator TaxID=610380 RepID=E2C7E4_HARSA|nr:Acetylcholine receptor subunit alpha-like [Harpegnathos saltator]
MSVEWDILEVPAVRNEKFYTCCDEPYLDITFNITMRRKTLFYTVNIIIPCMGISFLTVLTFYLPSDSGEKASLLDDGYTPPESRKLDNVSSTL